MARVLGNCPACGGDNAFGNVDVYSDHVLRGCGRCPHKQRIPLPPIRKKILYLDQFFYSHAFNGNEKPFVDAAERIKELTARQLLISPYSNLHEDETHLWSRGKELYPFLTASSWGINWYPSYRVEQQQLYAAVEAWQEGAPAWPPTVDIDDALPGDPHVWTGYFWIDVVGYLGDADRHRHFKNLALDGLVDLFPEWRKQNRSFEEDVEIEHRGGVDMLMKMFGEYMGRLMRGDYDALIDSPVKATLVLNLFRAMQGEDADEQKWQKVNEFMNSDHYRLAPYNDISARAYATLRAQVRRGAHGNPERAKERLSGFLYDVQHISTYAPYCDAIFIDAPMAEIMRPNGADLTNRYGTRVFSRSNWDEFMEWLDQLEHQVTEEMAEALAVAYP